MSGVEQCKREFGQRSLESLGTQVSPAATCPYTIQLLYTGGTFSTYLIREKDEFGEYPNIFAKVFVKDAARTPTLVVLSDTGTGLDTKIGLNSEYPQSDGQTRFSDASLSSNWNIATFLERVLNHSHTAPYVIITTHCHYDHIRGIQHLLDAKTNVTVLASSYDKGFITPWKNLQKHSLCESLRLKAPKYDARWVEDAQRVVYAGNGLQQAQFDTSITIIHTPGHTPDSISWYDHDSYTLCVGDMFYEKESDETRSGSGGHWDREPPQPVILNGDSDIVEWNASMHRLLDFVRYENRRLGTDGNVPQLSYRQNGAGHAVAFDENDTTENEWSIITKVPSRRRVALCASHVTIGTDAEFALLDMLAFMLRIQLDQVPRKPVQDGQRSRDVWLWDDAFSSQDNTRQRHGGLQNCQYSVRAPWSTIHRTTQ